jgi:phosphatidylglycerol:prolipoprotein diacylglycerol transferase
MYWYGLLVAIGFIVAIRIASREGERIGVNPDQLLSATLVAALFGLLGARVFYVLQNQPQYYIDGKHLGEALSLWQGGLTFYGGLFGAILGAWLYAGRYNLPLLRYLDVGALVAPLGQAIGRVGNLINGDVAGVSTKNVGVEYTNRGNVLVPADQIGHTQQPVALYDVAWELALFGLVFYLWRRRVLRPGQVAGLYLFGYAAGQLLLGAFRAAPSAGLGLKASQLTALPILAGGLWLFLRSARRGSTYADAPVERVPASARPRSRKPRTAGTAGATGARGGRAPAGAGEATPRSPAARPKPRPSSDENSRRTTAKNTE